MARLSIIIPTLNEAARRPHLLATLRAQTRPPDEIIVAEAGLTDGPAEAAPRQGAKRVADGQPGPGRQAGNRYRQVWQSVSPPAPGFCIRLRETLARLQARPRSEMIHSLDLRGPADRPQPPTAADSEDAGAAPRR